MKIKYFHVLFFLFFTTGLLAQNTSRLHGRVVNELNQPLKLVNVFVEDKGNSVTTDDNGHYSLEIPTRSRITISYSMIGYETAYRTVSATNELYELNIQLIPSVTEIEAVDVIGRRIQNSTKETLDISKTRLLPNTTGSIEASLITFPGVSSNNEMSSQYNVRGGNFDENSVYVNGIEIFRPLLVRSGEQEGLSFINSDMVKSLSFSSGGFDAEYGDKMSSVLDIQYKKPASFEATASLSLLGASAYVGSKHKNFTQMHGIRYKTAAYLLGTLDTKAEYKPTFFDYQTYLTYHFNPKLEMTFLGNISQNTYVFVPIRRETKFGTSLISRKLDIRFKGQEEDLFRTAFGAFTLNYKPVELVTLSLVASAFHSNENETYDIAGSYQLKESTTDEEENPGEIYGEGLYHEHARNRLQATVGNVGHQGDALAGDHKIRWGVSGQIEKIKDKISEWEWRDSIGYSQPHSPDRVDVYYNLKSSQEISTIRIQGYLQDTYKWQTNAGRFSFTGGLRGNYWSFNNEFLLSPRVSFIYIPYWEKEFSFRAASGIYYQAPFYKEIRREIIDEDSRNKSIELNSQIKAQRSVHFVVGGDYYFNAWERPFKLTGEAYLKLADRMISYTVENVNIRYSGINDSKAYTAGVDFKLFGELLPGTDSWINLSLMNSREKIDGISTEWTPRPNEKRYSFSLLFQDYWPTNPKYKLHLKFIWNDGMPYTDPHDPNYRTAFRTSPYRRVDIGASRGLVSGVDKIMERPFFRPFKSIWFNFEVFNLLGINNEGSYYWVTDVNNEQWAAPNYLTGRQFNFKILVDFK